MLLLYYDNKMKKGSVLIVVLWMLFFIGLLAIVISIYVRARLTLAKEIRDRVYFRYLTEAGLYGAMSVVKNDWTESYDTLNDIWCNSGEYFKERKLELGTFSVFNIDEEGKVRYGLIDEDRKINLNRASFTVLKRFFEIVGEVPSYLASEIADSIIDWRDEDDEVRENGAEDAYYMGLEPPYYCKNSDFQVLEELLLVKGIDEDVFSRIESRLSVFRGEVVAVNINTADSLVLESIGIDPVVVEEIISFRKGPDGVEGTEDDNVFDSTDAIKAKFSQWGVSMEDMAKWFPLLTVKSNVFSGMVGVSIGKKKKCIRFVFNRNNVIKYWNERCYSR